MSIPQIVLTILVTAALIAIAFIVFSFRTADKNASKFDTVGTTLYWQDSKIPFLGHIAIEYTKKGKPYQCATGPMLKPKNFKVGARRLWTIYTYHFPNKPAMSKAKKPRTKKA